MFIGELARLTGVSVPTIRYYETLGLLKPVKRTRGGFRVYDEHAVQMLHFIRHAQRLGFSLKEVRQVLRVWRRTGNPCPTVRALVTQRLDQLDGWLRSLMALRERLHQLTQMLEANQGNDPSTVCPCITATEPLDISLPYLPPEWRKHKKRPRKRKKTSRLTDWWWS
jgi:DNA-binding transcriptional MerR regulator